MNVQNFRYIKNFVNVAHFRFIDNNGHNKCDMLIVVLNRLHTSILETESMEYIKEIGTRFLYWMKYF